MRNLLIFLAILTLFATSCAKKPTEPIVIDETDNTETIVQSINIDSVWAGHPVGFCLYTQGDRQYIAYYNANRNMVLVNGISMRMLFIYTLCHQPIAKLPVERAPFWGGTVTILLLWESTKKGLSIFRVTCM